MEAWVVHARLDASTTSLWADWDLMRPFQRISSSKEHLLMNAVLFVTIEIWVCIRIN